MKSVLSYLAGSIPFLAGVGFDRWMIRRDDRRKMPYRWKCPNCHFIIRASAHEDTLRIAERHEKEHR